jgi:ATP-dependent DNA ligase
MIAELSARYVERPPPAWALAPSIPVGSPVMVVRGNTHDLCQLVTDYAPKFIPRTAIAEKKHDGVRSLWLGGKTITRGGMTIWCAAHLWPALAAVETAFGEPMFLDGEYVEPGGFGPTARRVSKAIHNGGPCAGSGIVWLWDAIPVGEWRSGRGTVPLATRKRRLQAAIEAVGDPRIRYVDHVPVAGEAHLRRLEAKAYGRGEEGIVIKDATGAHHPGRSRLWQRLKRSLSLTLPVIGYSEATAGGELGSIIVDHEGVGVRVKAGFSDRDRVLLWHYPADIIGRLAIIGAMEKTDYNSLRQARFVRWADSEGATL